MKKAMNWLSLNGVEYDLHDYKKEGVNEAWLKAWCKLASWDSLLNTRGTTWRKLNDGERVNVDEKKACELMKQYPSLVKRQTYKTLGTSIINSTMSFPSLELAYTDLMMFYTTILPI